MNAKKTVNKQKQITVCVILALTALAIAAAIAAGAGAIPQPAAEFYGEALLHGENADSGTNISAFDQSGTMCGMHITRTAGYYGLLSCNGDDSGTQADEGAEDGEAVQFKANGARAYVINGTANWATGEFYQVNILGLKNDSPYLYGCGNASLAEDGNGSNISTELWSCAFDRNDNASSMNFSVSAQTNQSLISCSVSGNRYFTCSNPLKDSSGVSYATVRAINTALLSWSADIRVNVTPVNDAPYFAQNLTTQNASDNNAFTYRANCSDVDSSMVYYYDNTTLFDIDSTEGLINFTPTQSEVGNHSIMITCSDEVLGTSQNFTLAVKDVNNPPALEHVGDLQARSGTLFTKQLTATDTDNDTLAFSDNSPIFEVNPATGIINFTPSDSQAGNYTVNLSVSDGLLSDYELINFTVRLGAFCGDGTCSGSESCSSCQADCGACQPAEGTAQAVTGEAGTAAETSAAAGAERRAYGQAYRCVEQWKCQDWLECNGGVQARLCRDENKCGTTAQKPLERRACAELSGPEPPSCSDGIKNQDEEDVDCGGVCGQCKRKLFAAFPLPEIRIPLQKLARHLPWALILALMAISAGTTASDQAHLRKIRKLPLKAYTEKIRRYRPVRRRIYRTLMNALIITMILSAYYYWFSDCTECIKRYLWMPVAAIATVPFIVSVALNKLEYSEYLMLLRKKRLRSIHERQMKQLTTLETKLALETEQEMLRMVKDYEAKNPENAFLKFKEKVEGLAAIHSEALEYEPPGEQMATALENAAESKELQKAARESFELRQLSSDAKALLRSFKEGQENMEAEKNFLLSMEETATNRILMESISSSKELTQIYNSLVDVYKAVSNKHRKASQDYKKEVAAEKELLSQLSELFGNTEQAEAHSGDKKWVQIYNLLVDLHDHYKKKHETA